MYKLNRVSNWRQPRICTEHTQRITHMIGFGGTRSLHRSTRDYTPYDYDPHCVAILVESSSRAVQSTIELTTAAPPFAHNPLASLRDTRGWGLPPHSHPR